MGERRSARRFKVGWEVRVTAVEGGDPGADAIGRLENLSRSGAFLRIPGGLAPGTRADLWIRIPFKRGNWMRYRCRVVRSEALVSEAGIAMEFEAATPTFQTTP